MIPLAFHGGTALHFLHTIRRHSEDLDFALERPGTGYDFRAYTERVRRDLRRFPGRAQRLREAPRPAA
jgi:predicted nucleotidyltransferase component of viral defense system